MPSKKESAFKYTFRTCNWLYILKKWISFSYLRLRHSFLIWEIQIIENMNECLCTWSFLDKSECYKSNSGSYQTASSVMTTYQLISLPSKGDSLAIFHSFVHMNFQYLGFICNFFPLHSLHLSFSLMISPAITKDNSFIIIITKIMVNKHIKKGLQWHKYDNIPFEQHL